jgi:hypothetical protein
MTPEARVKKMISTYLDDLAKQLDITGWELYCSMFVPVGYGKRNVLDYTLCIYGYFVAIEAKAPGEWLKPSQRIAARNIIRSGGKVFIISGVDGLEAFKRWVGKCEHRFLAD